MMKERERGYFELFFSKKKKRKGKILSKKSQFLPKMIGSQEIDKLKPYIQEIFKRVLKDKYSKRQEPYDKKSFSFSSLMRNYVGQVCVCEGRPFFFSDFPPDFHKNCQTAEAVRFSFLIFFILFVNVPKLMSSLLRLWPAKAWLRTGRGPPHARPIDRE